MSYRREAEHDVEVVSDPGQEVVVQVLIGRWSTWELLLHDGGELTSDLINLITSKQVGYLEPTGRYKVIQIQETSWPMSSNFRVFLLLGGYTVVQIQQTRTYY